MDFRMVSGLQKQLFSSWSVRMQAGNCLSPRNRAGCLEQVLSPSQRCWSVGWAAACWQCCRNDLSAGQGSGFVMVEVPFPSQDGQLVWMDLFWVFACFSSTQYFFLFIFQSNKQNVFTAFSFFFLNSRLLNFNVFYFIFFSGTLGSFETMMGFLATLHREGINVFIAWHFYGGLGGGEDGPWILN